MSVSLGVAFIAGLVSFISPCVLPMVPVYLASLVGKDVFVIGQRVRLQVFFHSLCFVSGLIVVFTVIGAGFGLFGFALNENPAVLRYVSGSLLVLFGLFLILSQWLPFLNYEMRAKSSAGRSTGYVRSFLIGVIFTLAWTPCVSPILASILVLAMNSNTAASGALLLAVYSLGMGIPFLIAGAIFDTIRPLLKRIGKYSLIIYLSSGALLIIIGILVLLNLTSWLM